MLNKIPRRLYSKPLILGLCIFGVAGLGTAIAITVLDVPAMILAVQAPQVTVAELQQGKLKPVLVIDVRSPEEYAEDHIAQSTLVPLTNIEAGFGVKKITSLVEKSVLPDRSKPTVVLYCTKGQRSTKAYKLLEATGLNRVVLSGGFTAWRKAVPAAEDKAVLSSIILTPKKLKLSPGAAAQN